MSAFHPQHDPPTLWDRTRASPIVLVAMWAVVVGVKLALMPVVPSFTPSPALEALPTWTALALAAGLVAGGGAAVVGLWNAWENRTKAWSLERSGWIIAAAAWAAYSLVVVQKFPGSTIAWGAPLMCAGVGLIRVAAIKAMKADVQRVKKQAAADLESM